MNLSDEKANLRIAILETVLNNSGALPVGTVRAVLAEVEQILISESDDIRMSDMAARVCYRVDMLKEAR